MQLSTRQKKILVLLIASCFLNNIAISIPAPFVPRENELRGYGATLTSLMLAFMPFTQIFSSAFWVTMVIPKLGVDNTLKIAVTTTAISTVLFGTMEIIPYNLSALYLIVGFTLRFLLGAGLCGNFICAQTYLTETLPHASTFLLSLLGGIGAIGSIAGPAIGGGLFSIDGFWIVFVVPGSVLLIFGIVLVVWLPAYEKRPEELSTTEVKIDAASTSQDSTEIIAEPIDTKTLVKKILHDRRMVLGVAVTMFSASSWYALDPILEPELRNSYGLSEEMSALMFLLLPTAFVIMTPITGKSIGKTKYSVDSLNVLCLGFTSLVATFLFAGPAPFLPIPKRLWLLVICLTIQGFGNSWTYVPGQDLMFDVTRLNLANQEDTIRARTFISGCWNACYPAGICIGMVISGIIQEAASWEWATTFLSIGSGIFFTIVIAVKVSEIKKPYDAEEREAGMDFKNAVANENKSSVFVLNEIHSTA